MPQVSRFGRLPLQVQEEAEERLVRSGFSGYVEFADELRRRGYRISKSALHRHGKALKVRLRKLRDRRLVAPAKT